MKNPEANILLVEDDEINQLVATNLLQKWGMCVSIANNGAEAINQITSKKFQVVLMDIQMPVMNGLESTRRIREMDDLYFKTVPIIAFTASGMIEAQEMILKSGMNDVITKPFIAEEMRNKISKYVLALRRPLFINFDSYTEGDVDYKKEMISLLISNLEELQGVLSRTGTHDDRGIFISAFHKAKVAINILNDAEFTQLVEEVKINCSTTDTVEFFHRKLDQLNKLCERIKESLMVEVNDQKHKYFPVGSTHRHTIPPAA